MGVLLINLIGLAKRRAGISRWLHIFLPGEEPAHGWSPKRCELFVANNLFMNLAYLLCEPSEKRHGVFLPIFVFLIYILHHILALGYCLAPCVRSIPACPGPGTMGAQPRQPPGKPPRPTDRAGSWGLCLRYLSGTCISPSLWGLAQKVPVKGQFSLFLQVLVKFIRNHLILF